MRRPLFLPPLSPPFPHAFTHLHNLGQDLLVELVLARGCAVVTVEDGVLAGRATRVVVTLLRLEVI